MRKDTRKIDPHYLPRALQGSVLTPPQLKGILTPRPDNEALHTALSFLAKARRELWGSAGMICPFACARARIFMRDPFFCACV